MSENKSERNTAPVLATDPSLEAPDGFDTSIGRQMADGWFVRSENAICQGRLLARVPNGIDKNSKKEKFFYQIKLQKKCKATTGSDKDGDKQEVDLEVDQIVNIDESRALEDLKELATTGGVYDIWIKFGAKKKVDKGWFWPIVDGPRIKVIKSPQGDEEIPF